MRQNLVDRALARALEDRVQRPFLIDTRSLEKEVELKVQLPEGVLRVVAPRRRLFSSTTYVFILWMVGTSLALFAGATVFMRNQVRPIRQLAAAADAFGKGRDVPERMKLELAMLGDRPEVAELKTDLEEMEKMIQGYLAFARGEGTEQPVSTDLSSLLKDVVNGALREGASVALQAEENIRLPLRRDAFRRCLANLIANAQRYANRVLVTAGHSGHAIEITIDDDGPGIPSDKREDVFKPFFRLDPSRNLETGGTGLGLTIARDVIRSHGGELVLTDSPFGGLRARLRLPV
jgi:two-component system osmolarity sensor histidine kinase EnvZ